MLMGYLCLFPMLYSPPHSTPAECLFVVVIFSGLHEEVDYSEKLKFSDDEEDHGDKNKMW